MSDLATTKARLDAISPTMCGAKWNQVSLHLGLGRTHSCHHPATHHIPLEEIRDNPSALHNTNFKKQQRKLMLEGKRPEECDYCWRVEDAPGGSLSDRVYKSNETWAAPSIESDAALPWDANVTPTYVEVDFGYTCNFKCSYCSPQISSSWMAEIEQHGGYPLVSGDHNGLGWLKQTNQMPILNREANPYVDAFWKWMPDLYPKLQVLRLTGGEPILNKNTFKMMDYIISNPRADLEFAINSNMCVEPQLMDAFLEKIKRLVGQQGVGKFKVFTSAEAKGPKAEYIRHGLDYSRWLDNIDRFLTEVPELAFTIMSTFNALSVTSYREFLADMLALRIKHLKRVQPGRAPLLVDFPYLRYPAHQAAYILTPDYAPIMDQNVAWMEDHVVQPQNPNVGYNGYHGWERDKLVRVSNVMKSEMQKSGEPNLFVAQQADFYRFFSEHDRRRGTDFLKTFPEMADFWQHCRRMSDVI